MAKTPSMRDHVARRIRELRTNYGKTGFSQEALANMIEVVPNTVSRWETGTYEPTLDDLDRLARALGVSILDFFPKSDTESPKEKKVEALLRTARGLHDNDLEELRLWAEYRRARQVYKRGRKR